MDRENQRLIGSWHWQQYVLLLSFSLLLALCQIKVGFAQTPLGLNAGSEGSPTTLPVAPRLSASALNNHVDDAVVHNVAVKPPLPFNGPQIGPLIKRAPMDDIERRTTAFIPGTLDHLTAVEVPDEDKWIRVDLSEQLAVAYRKDQPVRAFVISSGLPRTPTVRGEFRIITKVSEQTMYGGQGAYYYNLPGVKWVQYFYGDYSFHGTYWHSNFGEPMSHGCINMTNADAKWLFDWAGPVWDGETDWYHSNEENPGTLVIVTE